MIDDEDEADMPTRTGTPKPAPPEKDAKQSKVEPPANDGNEKEFEKPPPYEEKEKEKEKEKGKERSTDDASNRAPAELPAHIKAKLRKLEKLESTYPGMSRSLASKIRQRKRC